MNRYNLTGFLFNNQESTINNSLYHHLPQKAVGKTPGGNHRDIATQNGREAFRSLKIQDFVLRGPADPLPAGVVSPFNHYFSNLSEMSLVPPPLDLALLFLQNREAACLFLVRNGVFELQRRRVGPRRILEAEDAVVFDFIEQQKGLLEIGLSLPGEAHDDIGGNADLTLCRLHPRDALEILISRVETLHRVQHAGRAALDGQVDVIAEGGDGIDGCNDVTAKISGMGSCESYALDSGDFPHRGQQFCERLLPCRILVGIHVLPEQLDFAIALVRHLAGFGEHRIRGPAALLATGERNHTISAEFVAALNDGDVSPVRIGAGGEFGFETLVGLTVIQAGYTAVPCPDLGFDLN